MAWALVAGINGSGKTVIAREIKKQRKDIQTISGTNVLLRSLGENVALDTEAKISLESYQQLERLDIKTLEHAYTNIFPSVLEKYKQKHSNVILFYHLCITKKDPISGNVTYDNSFVRDWYSKIFDTFIFLDVSAEEIQARCNKDRVNGSRLRTELSLEQIKIQISKSNQEWKKLVQKQRAIGKNSCHIIPNEGKVQETVSRIIHLICC